MARGEAERFGHRLRELREAAGLTQQQLADKAGMHRQGIAKLEGGEREPAWGTVLALATALGVDCRAFQEEPASVPEPRKGRPPKPAAPAPEGQASAPAPKRPRGRPRKGQEG